jgi:hypothetical protein
VRSLSGNEIETASNTDLAFLRSLIEQYVWICKACELGSLMICKRLVFLLIGLVITLTTVSPNYPTPGIAYHGLSCSLAASDFYHLAVALSVMVLY